eukprot:XP_001693389.1 predicted protein [Chlamydomonas reinhardtii]
MSRDKGAGTSHIQHGWNDVRWRRGRARWRGGRVEARDEQEGREEVSRSRSPDPPLDAFVTAPAAAAAVLGARAMGRRGGACPSMPFLDPPPAADDAALCGLRAARHVSRIAPGEPQLQLRPGQRWPRCVRQGNGQR